MYQLYHVDLRVAKQEVLHEAYSDLTLKKPMTRNRSNEHSSKFTFYW